MFKKISYFIVLISICCASYANNKILVLGDSLSANYGNTNSSGWVSLLEQRLREYNPPITVINASVSGSTTASGLQRLPAVLANYQPNILIIELGGNDSLRSIPLTTIRANLVKMIEMAKRYQCNVILLGLRIPPVNDPQYAAKFQALYIDLAKEYNIAVVPLFLNGVDNKAHLMQPDGIHPNSAAQPIMLANVWQALQEMLNKKL